jgi:hypothetical protein
VLDDYYVAAPAESGKQFLTIDGKSNSEEWGKMNEGESKNEKERAQIQASRQLGSFAMSALENSFSALAFENRKLSQKLERKVRW